MTNPYYQDDAVTLHHGDCLDVMRTMPDASVHAVITDPPYELGFMGRGWDASGIAYRPEVWAECLRILKPGGHLLAFGGSRTWHRLAVAIEDAGFEMRDSIAWLYAQGFPKSLDVSKAIDRATGSEREVVGTRKGGAALKIGGDNPRPWHERQAARGGEYDVTAPATPDAETWAGWGTALKPAFEPIVVARKPLSGTVAATVLTHGTGAINVDACRVGVFDSQYVRNHSGDRGHGGTRSTGADTDIRVGGGSASDAGRWPPNVILDDHAAAELDAQSGVRTSGYMKPETDRTTHHGDAYGKFASRTASETYGDSGGISRMFPTFRFEPKAPTFERPRVQRDDGTWEAHETVKPLDLMRWLVRLVTPPGGVVLDPFAGSGTTAEACIVEGFECITIEREADYLPLIVQRLTKPIQAALDLGGLL